MIITVIAVIQELIIKILIIVFSIFLFVTFLVPFVKKIATHVGALDIPDERKAKLLNLMMNSETYIETSNSSWGLDKE